MLSDNPTAAILVIGDEILSGRTHESNAHYLAGRLTEAGFDLREIRVIPDEIPVIVGAIRELDHTLGGRVQHLFTSGGIGPTHDDMTADAVALAHDTVLEIHPGAVSAMEARYLKMTGKELSDNQRRMARIPVGATLITNAVSAAPGFSIGATHVMAGVPSVFHAMVDELLPSLKGGRASVSRDIDVWRGESEVAETLASIAEAYPDLSLGSYPFRRDGRFATNLVVRGLDEARVDEAFAALENALEAQGK